MPDYSHTASVPRLTVRLGRYLLPLLLLGLAVHLILPQMTTLSHSLEVIKGMALWAVALAVVAQVLSYVGSGLLLRAIVAVVGQRLSVVRGTVIFAAASSVGLVAGGMVGNAAATYRWVRRSSVSAEGAVLAGYGLPLLLGKVTFLPGGVGIVEGTMAALYGGLGVPDGVTVVVILTYRVLAFWLPTLLGFPLVAYLQRVSSNANG